MTHHCLPRPRVHSAQAENAHAAGRKPVPDDTSVARCVVAPPRSGRAASRHRTVRIGCTLLALLVSGAVLADPWRAASGNSYGWELMTPAERIEHQQRMRGFSTYAECRAYQVGHHERMEQRAREQRVTLTPREHSGCDQLRARGRLK